VLWCVICCDGAVVTAEELGGAALHCTTSGTDLPGVCGDSRTACMVLRCNCPTSGGDLPNRLTLCCFMCISMWRSAGLLCATDTMVTAEELCGAALHCTT
jgi:hypothetical protein